MYAMLSTRLIIEFQSKNILRLRLMVLRKVWLWFPCLGLGPPRFTRRLSTCMTVKKDDGHHNRQGATVDDHEIQQHSKLSKIWWNEKGEMKALHSMNKLRIPLVRDGLINTGGVDVKAVDTPHPLCGLKILDVGCGGGILTEALARIGANVTGVDASHELIETARIHASQDPCLTDKIQYVKNTIEDHAETHEEYYDAVIASEVLEHITEKDLFISACVATLKPGGSFFLTTLNRTFPSWMGGIIAAEYILKLLPQGTHDWNKFISPKESQILLEKHQCSTTLVHGMFYNFLANEWYWFPNTAINYALQAVKKKDP